MHLKENQGSLLMQGIARFSARTRAPFSFLLHAREEFLALVLKFLDEGIADGLELFIPFTGEKILLSHISTEEILHLLNL